ncbi:hypothetical protein L0657_20335 [Dyadobacter sp. CY345]|uniref:hypothetical protein n=1 Tax=Dyadobacter sp. CY345 TaxID=2909335 RepID=UPI001F393A49|nr:hypothetical protein [Dyadobacter sp. CY345]MCF2446318.1 hypothetical protein [Dyadobacter sp. CY345]
MLYYLFDIIPKIQIFSKKLDDISLLINQHWVSINETNNKTVFIFRSNEQLLISENGMIERAKWEYIGSNSLIVDQQSGSFLFKHGFLDDTILALKVDGTESYALFINETKYGKEINNIHDIEKFLELRYLRNQPVYTSGPKYHDIELENKKLGVAKLVTGDELVFYLTEANQTSIIEGCSVLLNGIRPDDDIYKSISNSRFEIANGLLVNIFYIEEHDQRNGDKIEIDVHRMYGIRKGCRVWLNDKPAPNGQYKSGMLSRINVLDGLIS